MAIRPNISLATRAPAAVNVPDVGAAFNNALLNVQGIESLRRGREEAPLRNRLLTAQAGQAEAGVEESQQLNRIRSLGIFANKVAPLVQSGDLAGIIAATENRIANELPAQGVPSNDSQELLTFLRDPGIPEDVKLQEAGRLAQGAISGAVQAGVFKLQAGAGGLASAKTEILDDGTVIQALPGGDVQVRNPAGQVVTGQERLDTLKRSGQFRIGQLEERADIAVSQAERTAEATNRASRVSSLTSELSGQSRAAKRGAINLNQAANLIEKAEQGLTGRAKVLAGRIFPGVDVTNEGALEQSLKLLALDELQKFKGPTTDFEFRVTEDVAGSLGSGRSANRARVRSLQRAGWFANREFEQFQKHVKSGGDPDTFGFNFGEPIKTKKGIFTLQDIQDTAINNNLSIEETLKRLNQ